MLAKNNLPNSLVFRGRKKNGEKVMLTHTIHHVRNVCSNQTTTSLLNLAAAEVVFDSVL